jgi:RNA polymerase sigma-70 factor (ECF subfamily)
MISRPRITRIGPSSSKFEDLMRPHFDRLYGRAFALSGNEADAEDLIQELCIRVHLNLDEVAELDQPSAWMWRVLYRLFVDLVRRRGRSPIRLLTVVESADGLPEQLASEEPGPEQKVDASITDKRLKAAWGKLDAEQQLLLSLHSIEGLSLEEIHELTDLPIGTIKSRLHRSRKRLGRLMTQESLKPLKKTQDASHELPRHRKNSG